MNRMNRFTDHGVPAAAVESRTAAVCRNIHGEQRIVIAARGFVVIVDPVTGISLQRKFPHEGDDYPYMCYADSQGYFYTGAGRMFLVLDPFQACFVHAEQIGKPDELVGFSFAEDRNGVIYYTAYPHCLLFKYEPNAERSIACGQLDEQEKYPSHLAIDDSGWIYAGVGTVRKGLIAFHSDSGRRKQLIPDEERTRGMAVVYTGEDGAVYGHWSLDDLRTEQPTPAERYRWMKFDQGTAKPVPWELTSSSLYKGESFSILHRQLKGEWRVELHDLAERELIMQSRDGLSRRTIPLVYDCAGAQLAPLVKGPDGHIYGTSNHPLHFYKYDVDEKHLYNFGGKAIELGGGGNLCAYAVIGDIIGGAAYAGGHLHMFDTTRPVTMEGKLRNPRLVASHPDIHRPRCAHAHSDGRHMIFGGFPGYGAIGGGLCLYDVETGTDTLLRHQDVVPYHSSLCLAEAGNGDLFGGTSVETPGGAEPIESRAKLYRLNWSTKAIEQIWSPVDAREIHWIYLDSDSRIHGLTERSRYFVFDPVNERVLEQQDWSSFGQPVRHGIVPCPDGTVIAALSKALLRLEPAACQAHMIAQPPVLITAGLALSGRNIYFAAESHLWSFALDKFEYCLKKGDPNELPFVRAEVKHAASSHRARIGRGSRCVAMGEQKSGNRSRVEGIRGTYSGAGCSRHADIKHRAGAEPHSNSP